MTFPTNLRTFQNHLLAVRLLVRYRIVLQYYYNITAESLATVTKQKMGKAIGKVVRSN